MQNLLKSKAFWITAIAIAVVVFYFGSNFQKTYVSETNILLLVKSEKSAIDFERIINNAKKIPTSLSFYNKLIELQGLEDKTVGLSDEQRKDFWNSQFEIKRIKKSGVIKINTFNVDQREAEELSKKIVQGLTTVMNRYYDPQNDLDVRVIDGPIVTAKNRTINFGFLGLSLLIGAISGMIVYLLSKINIKEFLPKKKPALTFPSMTSEDHQMELNLGLEDVDMESIVGAGSKKEKVSTGSKKAFAPENLPVGEEFVLAAEKEYTKDRKKEECTISEIEDARGEKIPCEPKIHEATEDEIRQRLNKLLGGK